MKVLVLGGAGFLGSHVADELTGRGHEVAIYDCRPSPYLRRGQQMIVGDIFDQDALRAAMTGSEIVYHFAGFADLDASIGAPLRPIELNVLGTAKVLDASCHAAVKRFVYASTSYALSDKGSFYGVSKRCAEQIIEEFHRHYGLDYTIVRYGSVYGPRADRQNRIYRIVREALVHQKVTFQGNGEEEREYIHVRDAARLSVDIMDEQYRNEHIILTGIERFRYADLLRMINEMLGGALTIEYLGREYQGHYRFTPYTFKPTIGRKLVANPFIDFGQGLLETMAEVHAEVAREPLDGTTRHDMLEPQP